MSTCNSIPCVRYYVIAIVHKFIKYNSTNCVCHLSVVSIVQQITKRVTSHEATTKTTTATQTQQTTNFAK